MLSCDGDVAYLTYHETVYSAQSRLVLRYEFWVLRGELLVYCE